MVFLKHDNLNPQFYWHNMIDALPEKPPLVAIDLEWMIATTASSLWQKVFAILNATNRTVVINYNSREYHLCLEKGGSEPYLQSVNLPKHTIRASAFIGKNFFISVEDQQVLELAITTTQDSEKQAEKAAQIELTPLDRAVINVWNSLANGPPKASSRVKINVPKAIKPVASPDPIDVIRAGAREIRELLFQIVSAHSNAGEKVTCQLRTYDSECILVIKTTTSIKTKPAIKTTTISEMMREAKRMRTWGKLIPLRAQEYTSQGTGSMTQKCCLRISPKKILSAYANDPTIPFATIGEELFDMVDSITGWDVLNYQSTRKTNPQSVFGRTYGIDVRSVADHWSGTQSWSCAVFNRSR